MNAVLRYVVVGLVLAGTSLGAQQPAQQNAAPKLVAQKRTIPATIPEPPMPSISPEQQLALDELSSRFAAPVELHQGWFRDRQLQYYDFGVIAQPVTAGRVIWPIHGFDAAGHPVAIRGQRPVFSTIPGLPGYSGVWRLTYLVTADHVQPNVIRDEASAEAQVRSRRAAFHETNLTFNLPIVARGSSLAGDTASGMLGWYEGRDVQFFDFGPASLGPVSLLVIARGLDAQGAPNIVHEQANIADTVPAGPPFPDIWNIQVVEVDSSYVANTLKSVAAVRSSGFLVGSPSSVRNCPVVAVDGSRLQRAASPVREFADLRAPFPPVPTRPQ